MTVTAVTAVINVVIPADYVTADTTVTAPAHSHVDFSGNTVAPNTSVVAAVANNVADIAPNPINDVAIE